MIRDPHFHGRRYANARMNPTEVVISEVQAIGGPKVVPLFAESVGQSREAAHLHTDGEILRTVSRSSLLKARAGEGREAIHTFYLRRARTASPGRQACVLMEIHTLFMLWFIAVSSEPVGL